MRFICWSYYSSPFSAVCIRLHQRIKLSEYQSKHLDLRLASTLSRVIDDIWIKSLI